MEIVFNREQSSPEFLDVEQDVQKKNNQKKKDVKFKSKQANRTDLETWKRIRPRSALTAPIQSRSGGSPSRSKKKKQANNSQKKGTNGEKSSRTPLVLPGYAGLGSGPPIPALVQQQMPPGVRLGNITSLNTDQHRFYSFNRRLLSRLVPLWGGMVRKAVYHWMQNNSPPAVSQSWVTHVEVILDSEGEVLDVQPFRLSGFWEIDNAAIKAFKQVRRVPNPPKEMVDENGYIHIQFQTEVLWSPNPRPQMRGSR